MAEAARLRMAPYTRLPEPPEHLGDEAAALWRAVVEQYELDASGLVLLETLCDAWERYAEARETLAREGTYVSGRWGTRAHPAASIEKDTRIAIARLVREMDLEGVPLPEPKRPARRGGV